MLVGKSAENKVAPISLLSVRPYSVVCSSGNGRRSHCSSGGFVGGGELAAVPVTCNAERKPGICPNEEATPEAAFKLNNGSAREFKFAGV